MSGPESRIVTQVLAYIRSLPSAYAHKVHGGPHGSTGEPDVDACVAGRAVKVEVKAPGRLSTLTPTQRAALRRWRHAGAIVGVVCSVDEVMTLLRSYDLIGGPFDVDEAAALDARTTRLLDA